MVQQICGQHGQKQCADGFRAKICTVLFSKTEKSRQNLAQSRRKLPAPASRCLYIYLNEKDAFLLNLYISTSTNTQIVSYFSKV